MASSIAASTAGSGGIIQTADSSGNLNLLSGTTTVLALTATGIAVTGTLSASGVTTNAAGSAALPSITTTGDTDTGVWFPAANTLAASTGGSERVRIDSSGNVQIGRTSVIQNGRLSVQNVIGSNTIETIQGGSGGYNYYSSAAINGGSYYHATFTENNTQRGSIVSNGTNTLYNTSSDQRLKENIKDAESSLSLVGDLQVRQFDWKSCNSHQNYGFVAQELAIIAPEAVHQPSDPEEMMAVDYSKLVPMLVKAIQEQQALIIQLQADVAALKGVKA